MPRSTPKLVFYLLLPSLVALPPFLLLTYGLARRAAGAAATETAGAAVLQEARSIAARLPRDLPPAELERRCRAEVQGSATRLTVIAADGRVLCDSEGDPASMVNHLARPEVVAALRTGTGFDRRESATVHTQFVYAAVRDDEGPTARVVRVALPAAILAGPGRHLTAILLLMLLATVAIALLPALVVANRIGRRLDRMVRFSQTVAGGELSARLPVGRDDGIGALEGNLNEMGERLQRSFQAVREESEKLQGMLGAMVEGVVVVGRDGVVLLMNERAQAIFGLPHGPNYHGRHLLELCRDPELHEVMRALTAQEPSRPARREITLADAERRVLVVSVSPLTRVPGPPAGIVLVFHDVTDLKRLEVMRRDFVANVSHELRTPLTAIRGYAETLLGGALEDARHARSFLAVIERHAERLGRLIDDLLTLSDLELGTTPLRREAIALTHLVHEVVEVLGDKAERGNVTLAQVVPTDLPPLSGDADRLQQVLINLVDNAVKYTPAGGCVTITARAAADGGASAVEVEVRDTGIGIPPDDLPRLTERFYRVDKARARELGGTGLGLAIVKHIVQAHGGRLEIASELNVGTTVRFSVPGWPESAPTDGKG